VALALLNSSAASGLRAARPERHSIPVPGGRVDLKRSYARGGSVKDVSITLRADDGREKKMKLEDFGLGGLVDKGASKAKLRGPKVY
jgi:hypothetical protein